MSKSSVMDKIINKGDTSKSEGVFSQIKSDDSKIAGLHLIHERLLHRLTTARYVVIGGISGIIALTFAGFWAADVVGAFTNELLRTAITTLATISTLALGYIAGSNIEGSSN